ncbi:peroxiredoxin family protein [Pseudohalioglobus lutimaris]|uniref:Thioredoxin family protein n=1 Tax=Pseudohalioglobus lutimaris TaxID=1737061 RepID=A0A2N5X563_9GAMM|nr:thioredoxin family protein [Pseudohalioglobus lutimaris]PLW69618.1 thioredoxin family protein [Pseudohalioglobus lutimaris]
MSWLRLLPLLFALSAVADEPGSLLDFELRSLGEPGRHSLDQYQGAPLLLMFFEPECSWCYRQFKVLNKLYAQCPGEFRPVAVGVNGSRRELLAEYRRVRPAFPAYQASSKLLAAIGGVPATPFTLMADGSGKPLGWLRGYMPEDELRPLLRQQLNMVCPA